jgi:iron complex outermembrane recepter protein
MSNIQLLRGVGAVAIAVSLSCRAFAQERLPSIDIGAAAQPQRDLRAPAQVASNADAPSAGGPLTAKEREKREETAYARTRATGLKTSTPILDTPRSVVIIPKQVLEDNAILNTQDAVKFVSGVQTGVGQYYDSYLIRGFSNGGFTYRDNLKLASDAQTADPAFVDRVEIVKGPSAMLYGRIQPGGLVNYIMKKPEEAPAYSIQQQFGSWGLARTTVDLTGPLTQDKSLTYRLIGVYDHADDFIDFRHRDNGELFGQLQWKPTQQFESHLGLEYYNLSTTNRGYYAQQVPALALSYPVPGWVGRPAYLPRNWTQNDPGMYSNFPDVLERVELTADWTYRFNDYWKITNRFLYAHNDEDQQYILWRSTNLTTDLITRRLSWSQVLRDNWSLNLDVSGKIETGPLKHDVLAGFDYFWYHQQFHGDNPPNKVVPEVSQVNFWLPSGISFVNYPYLKAVEAYARSSIGNSKQTDFGYYLQDDISYNDFIHLLLGGRYDVAFDANSEFSFTSTGPCYPVCDGHYNPPWKGNPTEHKYSPNVGLLMKVTPEVSLFGSYSRSFASSNAASLSFNNQPLPVQEAKQFEAGVKASLLDGAITGSIVWFDLYRTNTTAPDLAHPGFSVAVGQVRSEGLEFDVAGQMTDNISLIGSYTYDDAQIVADTTTGTGATLGKRFQGVPRHAGNVWAVYDTAPRQKEGWKFGFGTFANGERQGNNTNSWQLPGYWRFDMMGAYRTVVQGYQVEAQLNVVNLSDAKYFEGTDGSNANYGQPRTFIGSIKVKF